MPRNISDAHIEIPANAQFLEFPRSDCGSTDTWPTLTTEIVDNEGQVNFFAPVSDSQAPHRRWRIMAGAAVAKAMNMPEGPSYVFKSFPTNYGMFDHHKGVQHEPRHDIYLFGPPKKKFRSINEFIPHAIWLMSPNHVNESCFCKYCGGPKAQREITATISHIIGSSPGPSPTISRIKPKKDKGKGRDPAEGSGLPPRIPRPTRPRADPNLFGAVQKQSKLLRAGPDVLSHPIVNEAHRDVRAVHAKTTMQIRRYFREGEVVWCKIYPSVSTPGPEVEDIEWWPGVVEEYHLKSVAVPRATPNATSCDPTPVASTSQPAPVNNDDEGRGVVLPNTTTEVPWDVKQSVSYRIQLLGTKHVINEVADKEIIPYVSYCPSDELIAEMQQVPDDLLNFEKEIMHQFNPSPGGDGTRDFMEAVPPFALAMQIASGIASFWCVTDEFTMHFGKISHTTEEENAQEEMGSVSAKPRMLSRAPSQSVSGPSQIISAPPLSQPPSEFPSLSSAIQAASVHNDQVTRSMQYKSVSIIKPNHSQQESQRISRRIVGVQERASQIRYQGLWWGCERIWLGDFLRLKMPRRGLAPNGAQRILAPGGPSKSSVEANTAMIEAGQPIGAGNRGVFVRLDGLYAVRVPGEDGKMRNEARFCGPLFELVEQDWEGPDPWKDFQAKKQANDVPSAPPKAHTSLTTLPASQMSMPPQKDILPDAPVGFKFRPIVEPGWEFVGSMAMIGGRYYPRILQHPALAATVARLMQLPLAIGMSKGSNLWSLEGLLAGYYNSVDPHKYKKSRVLMMQDAERMAQVKLNQFLVQNRKDEKMDVQPVEAQSYIPPDDAMVVDQPQVV